MSVRVFLRWLGEQSNKIIYFKGTRNIFGIHLREQGIHVPMVFKGTLTKIVDEANVWTHGQ